MLYFAPDFDELVSDAFMVSLDDSDLIFKELNLPFNCADLALNRADLGLDLTHLQAHLHDGRQCSLPDGLSVIRACLKFLKTPIHSVEPGINRIESRVNGIESCVNRIEPGVNRIEPDVNRIEPGVKRIEPREYTLF